MKASQHPWELEQLVKIAAAGNSFLEIGSRYGETLLAIGKEMPKGSKLVAVDLPDGPWGRKKSQISLRNVCNELHESYGQDVFLFLADSRDPCVIEDVTKLGPYDFVFIDGDHRYDGVKADYENYGPLGKVVAFHDIQANHKINGQGLEMGVPKFWAELKKKDTMESTELIGKDSPMGVGVLRRA